MLRFAVLVLLLAVTYAFQLELDVQWTKFKLAFNKNYDNQEEVIRRLTWEENLANIIRHNIEADLGKHSYKMGINHLTDMNTDEVNRLMKGYKGMKASFKHTSTFVPHFSTKYPDEVDWRKEGMVTPVKDQKACGSCWAFSATGSVEGQHKKKTGKLVSLSEQNLMDCATDEGNRGCEGGLMYNAFEYIIKNGGIDTEACYPYDERDGPCRFNRSCIGATISSYVNISSGDEDALHKSTATVGPISVAIDASQLSFQLYSGGVYDEPLCSSTQLDHGVLIVGYGTENGKDYWLVKNSWGPQWGDQGYIKMARNKNNQCGIATAASYPIA